MDVQVPAPSVDESLKNDKETSLKIAEPKIVEEEDEFYDAGDDNVLNSSGTSSSNLNFSVANEDLPTDGSDQSESNEPSTIIRPKLKVEPPFENLDDISTEASSSADGNGSPRAHRLLSLNDHYDVFKGSRTNALNSETEQNEVTTTRHSNQDTVDKHSTDDYSNIKGEGNGENVPSLKDNVIRTNSSKSSIEVMEDDYDRGSSKSSSPEKVMPNSDAANENSNADVENTGTSFENLTKNGSSSVTENVSESVARSDAALTVKSEGTTSDANEILTMEDSDIDESFQENLDVALKVVEETSISSPTRTISTAEEPETPTKTGDSVDNGDNLPQEIETSSKSENILEEFREDAAQINGDSSEILDNRLCSCQVVLFRIDFDNYALKHVKNKMESEQSPGDGNTDSNLDSSSSRSEETCKRSPPEKRRVLTKAARKMMISTSESGEERQSPPVRSSRISARPRKNNRNANAHGHKYTYSTSGSSDSEDYVPLSSSKKRKVSSSRTKRSAQSVKKPSSREPMLSQKNDSDEKEMFEKDLSIDFSCKKILKCVSVPIISGIIDSLEHKSCRELIALIEQKANKLSSRTATTTSKENTTVARSLRRRKLSSSDISKSSVEDNEYKIYGKMWKYDEGTSREENGFSLRSNLNSPSSKRTSRKSAKKVQSYVECSESDEDKSPSKKAKASKINLTRVERDEKKYADSNGEGAEQSSGGVINNRSSRRKITMPISSRSRTRA